VTRMQSGLDADEEKFTASVFRKIGGHFAGQARAPNNAAKARLIVRDACRHKEVVAAAVDHYMVMNTPQAAPPSDDTKDEPEDEDEDEPEPEPEPKRQHLQPEPFDPASVGGMRISGDLLELLRVASQLDPKRLAGLLQIAKTVAEM